MIGIWKYIAVLVLTFAPSVADACTAVIISGSKTADGRPLMWKNRDTDHLDNSVRHFKGEKYSFTGLVNSGSPGKEVWIGANTAGFSIMNTASYCLKNDDVPASRMDREGLLMYRALEICATLADFEHFLDTLPRPLGIEANFGCIDAHGGAAWYETGNHSYYKRDVNVSENGFLTVTNFSVSGDPSRWKGVERWITADAMFHEMDSRGELSCITPLDIMDSLSRSYRHDVLGIDLTRNAAGFLSRTTGYFPDMDFIPRYSTSASVVIRGVPDGGDPSEIIIWTALGYPAVSVMVPIPVSAEDHVPPFMKSLPDGDIFSFCAFSMMLKMKFVFDMDGISNGGRYVNLNHILGSTSSRPSTIVCCRRAEKEILGAFAPLYSDFCSDVISEDDFLAAYDSVSTEFPRIYLAAFDDYISLWQ